jgi:hypothetical protein
LFILVCQLSSLIKNPAPHFSCDCSIRQYTIGPLAHDKTSRCTNFSRKARVKTQAFFFITSVSLFIFFLPSNTVFVSRTPKRQVRDPTGVTAGSLRRATSNAPRRRSPHRQSSPSPESQSSFRSF